MNAHSISIKEVIIECLKRLHPKYIYGNHIMLLVWICAVNATILVSYKSVVGDASKISFLLLMAISIWMTLIFANIATSIADLKAKKLDLLFLPQELDEITYRRVLSPKDRSKYELISASELANDNMLLIKAGEVVPQNGKVIYGQAYVNEAAVTGDHHSIIKFSREGHNEILEGSIVETDWLIVQVHFTQKSSFMRKIHRLIESITRHKSASEVALERLISSLAILFIFLTITIKLLAEYLHIYLPDIYFIALLVTLVPTTIPGLFSSISLTGANQLLKEKIWVKDKSALDTALDVNYMFFDKTGTLTEGRREAVKLLPIGNTPIKELAKIAYQSSIGDDTIEGKSIIELTKKLYGIKTDDFKVSEYLHIPFSSHTRISGNILGETTIIKGSVQSILEKLSLKEKDLNIEVKQEIENIAQNFGTPVLLARDNKIVGLIYLEDKIKSQAKEQIEQVQAAGIKVAMLTGDNESTARNVAKSLGITEYYANQTPESKLRLVRDKQEEGEIVACFGDGLNDALALAQADIGITTGEAGKQVVGSSNIVLYEPTLEAILKIKRISKRMVLKRGNLTIFSIFTDIAKYFAIVPALFITNFPELSVINLTKLHNFDSAILSSIIFNSLIILGLIPMAISENTKEVRNKDIVFNILLYGIGGLICPFISIKLINMAIIYLKVVG